METLKFSLTTPHFQNHLCDYHSSRILGVYNKKGLTFSFSLTCKLKTSKGEKINKIKIAPGIIFLPDSGAAPPLLERKKVAESTARNSGCWPEMELGVLSYLSLAIGEMFAVAVLMALETRRESPHWKWISTLSLDHMCSSPIVLGTLALLGASFMARTYTTQIPLVNVARRRYFSNSAETIRKQEDADAPPRASVKDSGVTLQGAGYEVFLKGPSLHAFKGLAGRFASIGVHLALLLVMSGGSLDTAGSLGRDVTVPQGLNSVVGDVLAPSGVHVNRCYIDYDEFGEVPQFHTDISLLDLNGNEVLMKTISVDDPLIRRPNLKLPIDIDGTKLTHPGAPIVYASLGSLMLSTCISYLSQSQGLAGRFASIGVHLALLLVMSGGSLDTAGSLGRDVTVPQGLNSVVGDVLAPSGVHVNRCYIDYDEFGEVPQFHTDISLLDLNGNEVLMKTISVDDPLIRRPNLKLPIDIDGTKLTHPGAPIVYASLGSLMLSTCISYLSQSQLSALQDGKTVVVDGKTDRATSKSSHTGNSSLNQVPELLESSSTEESDSFIGFRIQVGIWNKKDFDM